MKHLTVESKDLLVGDEAADVLVEYAALVAREAGGDTVTLNAISRDGAEVVVTIVLSAGTTLLVETTQNSLPAPDNTEAVAAMREKLQQAEQPPSVQPDAGFGEYESQFDDL